MFLLWRLLVLEVLEYPFDVSKILRKKKILKRHFLENESLVNIKIAVLGAGAMGSLFGGLLAEKGLDVVLIDVWKEHVDAINKKGLKMDGYGGDRFIKIKATIVLLNTPFLCYIFCTS